MLYAGRVPVPCLIADVETRASNEGRTGIQPGCLSCILRRMLLGTYHPVLPGFLTVLQVRLA